MELTTEQIRIIESKPNGHSLIKGVAGSGKTTVAVQKIPSLVNHYMTSNGDRVLLITYNRTLIQYIKHIYTKMDLNQSIFFPENIKNKIIINTVDQIIMGLYQELQRLKYKNKTGTKQIISDYKKREFLTYSIREVNKKYTEDTIVTNNNMDFLIEELDWIKSCKYTERTVYQNVDRVGRMSGKEENNRFALQKNSVNRNAIYDLFEGYETRMLKEGFTDFKSMALVVLKAINNGFVQFNKYSHIIIDESQDLTKVQLEIISKMYNDNSENASITFIADTAQSIYQHSWLAYNSFKSIGFDMSGRAKILSKNHRTTMEIAMAAYSMIERDEEVTKNENYVEPKAVEKHGDRPVYKHFETDEEELAYIEQLIKTNLCKNYELHDIAILARTKFQLETAQTYLSNKGISVHMINKQEQSFDGKQVHLMTLHSIKGLEFPVIIIMGINDGLLPYEKGMTNGKNNSESIERKLLYVGMTRAKSKLYLTSAGKASRFISEINPTLLLNGEHEFSPVRNIGLPQYKFTDKIRNFNSYEEMVRQWYIEELQLKLGYPLDLMDIEYKVQAFSKIGFVDLVIFREIYGDLQPFIFAEFKKKGENLADAMVQLQQYIGCYQTVQYGVVTDGEHMVCIQKADNAFEEISKLPKYKSNIANDYKEFDYVNVMNKNEYKYQINKEDQEEIVIRKKNNNAVIDIKKLVLIKVYGKVAAGPMQVVYENVMDQMLIPTDFLVDENNCFGLEVNGDSMIEVGISKGDYVIVHRQNTANRKDIVIAVNKTLNEATMKRFDIAGNLAILSPENSKYESIVMPLEDLVINGVVIGVLKKD